MAAFAYLKYSDSLVTSATVQAKDPDGAHDDYTVDANYPLANLKATPVQRPTKIEIPAGSVTAINIQIDFGASADFDATPTDSIAANTKTLAVPMIDDFFIIYSRCSR